MLHVTPCCDNGKGMHDIDKKNIIQLFIIDNEHNNKSAAHNLFLRKVKEHEYEISFEETDAVIQEEHF